MNKKLKLGLVRHFKVDIKHGKPFQNSAEFEELMRRYDSAPVIPNEIILNNSWETCYCSTLPRAITTAQNIFQGEIIYSDLLLEVTLMPFVKTSVKLPSLFWRIGSRIAWAKNHSSQNEGVHNTTKRIIKILDQISETGKQNILIVSHGFFLRAFTEHLKKKGFSGEIDPIPKNGKLYVFEK